MLHKALKDHLTATFGLSHCECASQLLRMCGLGDCRPSQLMDEMLALLDGHTPCLLFEQIFLEQLPEDVHLPLANANFSYLCAVSLLMDTLWLACDQDVGATTTVSHVSVVPKCCNKFSSTSAEFTDTKGLCFYHARFRNKAHKCKAPCAFLGNALADCH